MVTGLDQVNLDGPQGFNVSSSAGNGVLSATANGSLSGDARGAARLVRRHTEVVSGSATKRLKLVFVGTGSAGGVSGAGASSAQLSALF